VIRLALFLFLILTETSFAFRVEIISDSNLEMIPGETKSVQLKFYKDGKSIQLSNLKNFKIPPIAYVSSINFKDTKKEEVEGYANLTIVKTFNSNKVSTTKLMGKELSVYFTDITSSKSDEKPGKGFYILDQYVLNGRWVKALLKIIISFLGMLGIAIFIQRKKDRFKYMEMKRLQKVEDYKGALRNIILLAGNRPEIETIYKKKKELEKYKVVGIGSLDLFFNEINKYQFKREWSQYETDQVNRALEKLKRSVN
jgi:hypothetical protein